MISTITLHNVLPDVFRGRTLRSDIWQKEVVLEHGKTYLIEAESGTGKSSLCSFIYGYRTDYQGNIRIDNRDIQSLSDKELSQLWQKEIGILFQELRLFSSLTAQENVMVKNQQTHFRSAEWIKMMFERLGISEKQDQLIRTLSFGQQQRVAFLRMLCQPASFLLMDEPISHLDESNAQIITEILKEEVENRGVGIVCTSVGKHLPLRYDGIYSL